MLVLHHAPPGRQGAATAAMQLTDNLGVALGAGRGGALIAAGAVAGWPPATGIAGAFALAGAVGLVAAVVARRLPDQPLTDPGAAPPAKPAGRHPGSP